MSNEQKQYLNSIFVKKANWTDRNDPSNILLGAGIKVDEFIKELQKIPQKANGFINLSIGRQKNDPSKYSVWVDTWVPNSVGASTRSNGPVNKSNQEDQLPF